MMEMSSCAAVGKACVRSSMEYSPGGTRSCAAAIKSGAANGDFTSVCDTWMRESSSWRNMRDVSQQPHCLLLVCRGPRTCGFELSVSDRAFFSHAHSDLRKNVDSFILFYVKPCPGGVGMTAIKSVAQLPKRSPYTLGGCGRGRLPCLAWPGLASLERRPANSLPAVDGWM